MCRVSMCVCIDGGVMKLRECRGIEGNAPLPAIGGPGYSSKLFLSDILSVVYSCLCIFNKTGKKKTTDQSRDVTNQAALPTVFVYFI